MPLHCPIKLLGMRRLSLLLLLLLTACSDAPKPVVKKEPPPPPKPITGREALYKVLPMARAWDREARIVSIESIRIDDMVKPEPGRSGAWRIRLASTTKQAIRSFSWSAVEVSQSLHEGTRAIGDQPWDPQGKPFAFHIAGLRTDSDKALAIAEEKSQAYLKKHPGQPSIFLLEINRDYNAPSWRVFWGESMNKSSESVLIDAATGAYIRTLH
jgi:hypothetical protein